MRVGEILRFRGNLFGMVRVELGLTEMNISRFVMPSLAFPLQ